MIELAARSTVILAAAWLIVRLMPRAAAATRHLVWHAAIVAVLAAPLLSPLLARIELPLPATLTGAIGRLSRSTAGPDSDDPLRRQATADGRAYAPAAQPIDAPLATSQDAIQKAWFLMSTLVALWFAAGWLRASLSVRRAAQAPVSWVAELEMLRRQLHIRRPVGLRLMRGDASPLAAGLLRATVLLPPRAASWSDDRRRTVLLHELAHVKRGDCRVQALAQIACTVYWFNPLAWMAFAALRTERERACDDEVLRCGALASTYATHLLEIARELRPASGPQAALAMARPSELEGRLLAVLAAERARTPRPATRWLVAAAIAVISAAALAGAPSASAPAIDARIEPSAPPREMFGETPTFGERLESRRARSSASATIAESPDAQARERAVLDLAAASGDATIPPLLAALDDRSPDVREKAALALGLLSSADVIPGLLKALADPDAQVREKAALGLALRRDARVADALLAAVADPDPQVREKVVMALGTSGDQRAAGPLSSAASDPDPQVREKAVVALGLLNAMPADDGNAERVRSGLRGLVGAVISLAR